MSYVIAAVLILVGASAHIIISSASGKMIAAGLLIGAIALWKDRKELTVEPVFLFSLTATFCALMAVATIDW